MVMLSSSFLQSENLSGSHVTFDKVIHDIHFILHSSLTKELHLLIGHGLQAIFQLKLV